MKGLGKYISSDYVAASNALAGRKACRKVMVYVESYDDVFFWRSILSRVETAGLRFVVTLPTRDKKLERGKKAALMSALKDNVGRDMIACVDADYDWLRQGAGEYSKTLLGNPYVFHTYAYSIENLQCWAPSLHDVCVMVTLNDSPDIVDFEAFLASYSVVVYPLFVWSVLCSRNYAYGKFDISSFMTVIKTGSIAKHALDKTLERVGEKVAVRLRRFAATASNKAKQAYAALDSELKRMGVLPEETYLYIQGHQLFNEVVAPLVSSVCSDLIRRRENEIQAQSKHNTQRNNEMSCYERSLESVTSMLKKNTGYLRSPQVARILSDLRRYVDLTQNKTTKTGQ
ncbi:MAG: DUF4435 domain-containing protein [Prevotella sp.]|nr:DUF4435 domain-containing protein [Prevotella sp.]